jgi:hypothetical protein
MIRQPDHQPLLGPDDLGANGEAILDQTLGHHHRPRELHA